MMTLEEHNERKSQSFKLILWFAMLSMVMMFAGLTSAFIVSTSRPDWLNDFKMPTAFMISVCVMLISSVTFHNAKKAIQLNNRTNTSLFLGLTLFLGLLFVFLQFEGFNQIIASGYYFTGSESSVTTSFLYIVVIAHLLHLFGGLIALLIIIFKHYKKKYNPTQYLGIELGAMFWHFLDLLWILLFLFFYFY
jgi:cytochrome c oxidase subunit 3